MNTVTIMAIVEIIAALTPYILQGIQYFIEKILPLIIDGMKKSGKFAESKAQLKHMFLSLMPKFAV